VTAVDADRLAGLVERLGRVGAQPGGGIVRHQYSPSWAQAQDVVATMMAEAGLTVRRDAVGNVFGRIAGTDDSRTVLTGSHVDTVTLGGAYDGALGVLSGIAALEVLAREDRPPRRGVEVVSLCEEEGGRFHASYFGTRAILGQVSPTEPDELLDEDGTTLADAARSVGLDPNRFSEARREDLDCFVELHIEQGRTLVDAGVDIGVVDAIVGLTWLRTVVEGRTDHAGTTSMSARRDALQGAARMVAEVEQVACRAGHPAVATVGELHVLPGAPNIVPGGVELYVDVRHPDPGVLAGLVEDLEVRFAEIAAGRGLTTRTTRVKDTPGLPLDADLRGTILEQAERLGFSTVEMPSGAGHDSQTMGTIVPTAMIFVPSVDGRSHSPAELSTPQACAKAATLLAATLRQLAW
jgi:allantoate deiminase